MSTITTLTLQAVLAATSPFPSATPASYQPQALAEMQTIAHTVTKPQATAHELLQGAAIAELWIDSGQTRAFLQSGRCHEIDPLTSSLVRSLPIMVITTSVASYEITRAPNKSFWNALLGLFVASEALNIYRNARVCG